MTDDLPALTGRTILAWLTAHPEHLDLPVMLLPMTLPLNEAADALIAEQIDYDRFNPDSDKGWIVLTSAREVGDDD